MSPPSADRVLAVDIGGGSVKLALTNRHGDDLGSAVVSDVPNLDRRALLDAIGQAADELVKSAATPLIGAAIGVPGFVSRDGRAASNSNVPVLDGMDLVAHFER